MALHREDRDYHQEMVDLQSDNHRVWGKGLEEEEGLTFHPPTINELLEAKRQRDLREGVTSLIEGAVAVAILVLVVIVVLAGA